MLDQAISLQLSTIRNIANTLIMGGVAPVDTDGSVPMTRPVSRELRHCMMPSLAAGLRHDCQGLSMDSDKSLGIVLG